MGNLLKSWLFFTALLVFLLTAAVTLPKLSDKFFGDTEQQLEAAVAGIGDEVQEVWAAFAP